MRRARILDKLLNSYGFSARPPGHGPGFALASFSGRTTLLPDLEAVYGKGPYHTEPASVARARVATPWRPPLPIIKEFAAALEKRGIALVFVPVPTKPMVATAGLGLRGAHPGPGGGFEAG